MFLRKPLSPSLGHSSPPRPPVGGPSTPTLLSLALTQTWLWVYSLLKEWVRSRKHCRESKRLVRDLLGPGSATDTGPGHGRLAEGSGTPGQGGKHPHLSQVMRRSEEAPRGRPGAWAGVGVGPAPPEVREAFPVAHPAAERASSGVGGELPISIGMQERAGHCLGE